MRLRRKACQIAFNKEVSIESMSLPLANELRKSQTYFVIKVGPTEYCLNALVAGYSMRVNFKGRFSFFVEKSKVHVLLRRGLN